MAHPTPEIFDLLPPARVQLFLDTDVARRSWAEVVFAGSTLTPVQGSGQSALAALTQALESADHKLQELRASGGRVLAEHPGFGRRPFEQTLQRAFRLALEPYGLVEPKPDAEIVSGPTPDDSGDVLFVVRVEDRLATIRASADSVGFAGGDNFDDCNVASGLIHAFLRDRPHEEKIEWYKEAARLRRAAGNPPPYELPRLTHIVVAGEPVPGQSFVRLAIEGAGVPLFILFSHRGGVGDLCDDWSRLNPADRNAAFATAVDYALANRDKMVAAGLDMDLFTALHG